MTGLALGLVKAWQMYQNSKYSNFVNSKIYFKKHFISNFNWYKFFFSRDLNKLAETVYESRGVIFLR